MLVVGTLTRNLKVGMALAFMLAVCGLLGNEFWEETVLTIGLVVVSVVICALVGIPLGVLCGRVDGVWSSVRPVLDAMQVVHAFVYIIPFIFFFGLGPEPATMVTMVFAIPPLIRLTNLGIRQVPADVVEASRAYGASEWRVLLDVQIPLARPAIMTGLNQTLLLSISMIGIAAIMGASGLGLLVFRAVINIDTPLSASAGLALFIVAVVLDRISQTETDEGFNLFGRIYRAWAHRRHPEKLLDDGDGSAKPDTDSKGRPASTSSTERIWVLVALIGSVVGMFSVFMPWSMDSGPDLRLQPRRRPGPGRLERQRAGGRGRKLLRHRRLGDEPSGPGLGSHYPDSPRPDSAVVRRRRSLAIRGRRDWPPLSPTCGSDPPLRPSRTETGSGCGVALVGGLITVVSSIFWIRIAPYSPLHPLRISVSVSRIVMAVLIVGLLVAAGLSPWFVDARAQSVITPELQAELDELEREARADTTKAGQNAITIATLVAEAQRKNPTATNGFSGAGPGLGQLTLWMGVIGVLFSLPAAGLFGGDERRRWMWSVAVSALGVGVMLASAGWIASLVRASDRNFVSGPGSFLCLLAGFVLLVSSRNVLKEFRRTKVYAGDTGLMGQVENPQEAMTTGSV